jgi:hypothetical protein
MCGVNDLVEGSPPPPRVRWGGLYVVAGLMLAALLMVQALLVAGAERTTLQCGLVLGGFGAMALWTRRNRTALDHIDWCACASSRVTVRVIPSGRQEPAHPRYLRARPLVQAEPPELEEISR